MDPRTAFLLHHFARAGELSRMTATICPSTVASPFSRSRLASFGGCIGPPALSAPRIGWIRTLACCAWCRWTIRGCLYRIGRWNVDESLRLFLRTIVTECHMRASGAYHYRIGKRAFELSNGTMLRYLSRAFAAGVAEQVRVM